MAIAPRDDQQAGVIPGVGQARGEQAAGELADVAFGCAHAFALPAVHRRLP